MTALFGTSDLDEATPPGRVFGERNGNNRYHMPLLPGEKGTKAGGDWVPYGIQSATNLAGAIVESRQLGIWERERTQIGLALRPDLYQRISYLVKTEMHGGLDLRERLSESPAGKKVQHELDLIHREAKQAAYGNEAAQKGTNQHNVWEARAETGQLFGTPEQNEQVERLEQLLQSKHLRRMPGLHERVVRNTHLRAAGRFDDILQTTERLWWKESSGRMVDIPAGTLLMADLKTKQRAYYSWLEVRIQLAVYATAEWMLEGQPDVDPLTGVPRGPARYVEGPKRHVNQEWGVILWAPSNGAEPQLKRANLVKGFQHAVLARAVCDARSEAKNVEAHGEAEWPA